MSTDRATRSWIPPSSKISPTGPGRIDGARSELSDWWKTFSENPFTGAGKAEPLRGQLGGKWSRRIDQEHRLVYEVGNDRVYFLAARYHY